VFRDQPANLITGARPDRRRDFLPRRKPTLLRIPATPVDLDVLARHLAYAVFGEALQDHGREQFEGVDECTNVRAEYLYSRIKRLELHVAWDCIKIGTSRVFFMGTRFHSTRHR
jgi:hypothetical protein